MRKYKIYTVLILALTVNLMCLLCFDNTYHNTNSYLTKLTGLYPTDNKLIAYGETKYIESDYSCDFKDNSIINSVKVDITKPEISYKKTITTTEGKKIDLLKDVKVEDNSGEDIKATVEGKYDFNKAGTYKLKYVAIDSSNNKTEVSFTLKVNKKQQRQTTTQPVVVAEQKNYEPVAYTPKSSNIRQNIVDIARSQLGNVNGKPYWSWYGFNGRVEWCACFVSWVANQAGVLNTQIPKFAGVSAGVNWFRSKGQFKGRSYTPSPGDIIFFDYSHNGRVEHVGIVEKVENGKVYTIEGNSTNACKNRTYDLGSRSIYGYGVPSY